MNNTWFNAKPNVKLVYELEMIAVEGSRLVNAVYWGTTVSEVIEKVAKDSLLNEGDIGFSIETKMPLQRLVGGRINHYFTLYFVNEWGYSDGEYRG
jgi:hypothetical protein